MLFAKKNPFRIQNRMRDGFFIFMNIADFTYIDLILPAQKFKVDHIFQRKAYIILLARQKMPPQAEIHNIHHHH